MKLLLTRHGETEENIAGILQGHMPGKLTDNGIEQAKKLALRLDGHEIDVIFSSDLDRAVKTAKEIIKKHPNAHVHYTKELRERNLGSYQGKHREHVDWENQPQDIETLQQMKNRAKDFLYKVYHENKNKTVLLVTHGGIGRSLISVIFNKPADKIFEMDKIKNTAIYIFEIKEDLSGNVILENCTKHLETPKVQL
jgi:broad specificity phosphatase PhoE